MRNNPDLMYNEIEKYMHKTYTRLDMLRAGMPLKGNAQTEGQSTKREKVSLLSLVESQLKKVERITEKLAAFEDQR